MNRILWAAALSTLALVACSGDDEVEGESSSSSSSSGDTNASSSSGGPGESSSGQLASSSSGELPGTSGSSGEPGADCTAARAEALQEQTTTSTGIVSIVPETDGEGTLLYVDASGGGSGPAASAPRVYVSLANKARVDVSDVAAQDSTSWDLALKRTNAFSNGGVGGPGTGGAQRIAKPFAEVTAADATNLATEAFFDADCELKMRVYESGAEDPSTFASTLSAWYDYDETTHAITASDATYLVRGAAGALYKVRFESYKGTPEGTPGETTGRLLLRVAALP